MTYSSGDLQKEVSDMVVHSDMDCMQLTIREVTSPGEWVLLSALHRKESHALFALAGRPDAAKDYDHPWLVCVGEAPTDVAGGECSQVKISLPARAVETIKEGLHFSYPHKAATSAPSKQTATQRKGRDKDKEAAENAPEPKSHHRSWRKASFVSGEVQGKARGSATHLALQYLRFENCSSLGAIEEEIRRLVAEGYLSPQQGEMVECQRLARFFESDIGFRLRTSENVLREFKFSILDDGAAFDPELEGEKLLLQGVVDCALMDDDGIVVMDFKTDRVTEETVHATAQRYRPQVEAYAEALSRIFEKNVKAKMLYFFHLDRFVEF